MKLVVRQYLQGMKERGGLDILLPELLSELGYEVIHHPRIGTRQAGIDVAAVGPDPDAENRKSLFLFVIESGDVGRGDWDESLQAVRPSLGEVIDDYIQNRISQQYRNLPVVVCLCMGGEIQEGIRSQWRGFVENCSSERVGFREWNGDRLANLILSGILKQELLDPDHRSHFQKAVALVSEPEESYANFRSLVDALTEHIKSDPKGTTRLRQMLICLWILVSSGLDADNLDAPYRACELALLHAWDAFRRCPQSRQTRRTERLEIFHHILALYLDVSHRLVADKIGSHARKPYALSSAVQSHSALDVNLALFDALGRTTLLGLWHHFIAFRSDNAEQAEHLLKRDEFLDVAIEMIDSNPTLLAPMRDDQHIEIGILMLLAHMCYRLEEVKDYLCEVASRLAHGYARRFHWATCFQDYRRLARHPIDQSDAYFQRSTAESVLVPFILVGLERLGETEELQKFRNVVDTNLPHMTQQVWVPQEGTDGAIWRTGRNVGFDVPVPSLRVRENEVSLSEEVNQIAAEHREFLKFEAIKFGLLPLFLVACRHHRLPLPPHIWYGAGEFTSSE